ncbi:inovirus Gp2 family protein [Vibrio tubiashii]|uniref:YagK/YfjJ domain-containing protein n=1 Tax=Vibrio tubiashii TaxID=29498 RepID=UPI001EFEA6F1|nr:inovirus-type Gp2 protein [Vibrio tubiashii]MCG9578654.1 inovirus Gp2 family protein [Vibrio tubiashii]
MSNNTYLPNITHSKTFKDYPVFFSDKGLYESALTRMTEVFEQATEAFDAALATRLDLFLPEDHQDTDLSIINDYFKLLKEKLDTESVFYVWRKREDKVPSHNYRVMLFTDYSQYFGPAICWDKRSQLVSHLRDTWQEGVDKHYNGKSRSIVFLNDRGNFGLGTRCRSKDTNIKRTVFHRMSALAEAWKEYRYSFGSSVE